MGAGIAIPVPGAAKIAALLNHPDVGDASLYQPGTGHQTSKAATNKRHGDVICPRRTRRHRGIRIFQIMGQLALQLQILIVAIGTQALVALFKVFLPDQGFGLLVYCLWRW